MDISKITVGDIIFIIKNKMIFEFTVIKKKLYSQKTEYFELLEEYHTYDYSKGFQCLIYTDRELIKENFPYFLFSKIGSSSGKILAQLHNLLVYNDFDKAEEKILTIIKQNQNHDLSTTTESDTKRPRFGETEYGCDRSILTNSKRLIGHATRVSEFEFKIGS